MVGMLL